MKKPAACCLVGSRGGFEVNAMNDTRVEACPFEGPYVGDPEAPATPPPEGRLHTCSAGPRGGLPSARHEGAVMGGPDGWWCGGTVRTPGLVVGNGSVRGHGVTCGGGDVAKCRGCRRRCDSAMVYVHPENPYQLVLACMGCERCLAVVSIALGLSGTPPRASAVSGSRATARGPGSPPVHPVSDPAGSISRVRITNHTRIGGESGQ